jgi:CDP-6-deoxy-D-xylo-4-hexulose-3-dehydrase
MKKYTWPLMKDTITFLDKLKMINFILRSNKFTNGNQVKQFEKEWSEWLNVDHSLFVSSGSTANLLLLSAVKEKFGLKDQDKIVVPACTWVTNISPVIQCGLQPIFCDINFENYSFDLDHLKKISLEHPDIKGIFVTHLLGFDANIEKIKEIIPSALILEDVCESHGVTDSIGNKRGSSSLGATFSFYFGHHMTTIEGGMVSTTNEELHELMRLKRSHGLAREGSPAYFEKYKKEYPDLPPSFLFLTEGYNFRNHEIPAVLGQSQLKRLTNMVDIRKNNFIKYFNIIKNYEDKFYLPEFNDTNSSFAFPFVSKSKNTHLHLIEAFTKFNIEHRPIVSGNLLAHPFLKEYKLEPGSKNNVNLLHNNGVYIGNNHFVNQQDFDVLTIILESIK